MKAAVLTGIENLEIREIEMPSLKNGELLIRIGACAICKTDVKMFYSGQCDLRLPRVLGHEVSGTIIEVGKNIDEFDEGERVQIAPGSPCGSCSFCIGGASNMCERMSIMGFHHDGGFAKYMVVPTDAVRNGCVNRIPKDLPFEEACLAEPIACCINGQERCQIKLGDAVAIFGAGPIRHMHAQLSKLFGASEIIFIENSSERIAFFKKNVDSCEIIDPREVDVINVVKEMTDGAGADVVIPACSSPEIIVQGIGMLKKRGRIVFFSGLPNEHKNISIDHNLLHYKEIQVCGAYGCTSEQNRKAVNLLSKRKINVNYLITERISLDGIIRGFELITAHKAMKVVVTEF